MNLIQFLKNEKNARKIFGKRELKIIEKQLLSIALTQSEKNRLSRDIRKKFEFIKNVGNYSEEFELKKGAIIKQMITDAKEAILTNSFSHRIKRIILYGSFIENQMTFRSDIDIAVDFKDITLKEATLFRINVLKQLNDKIDVQVYNVLPEKIKKEIDAKGKVLYKR